MPILLALLLMGLTFVAGLIFGLLATLCWQRRGWLRTCVSAYGDGFQDGIQDEKDRQYLLRRQSKKPEIKLPEGMRWDLTQFQGRQ